MACLLSACSNLACAFMQLEDDLLYKLSSAEGDMTEDLALIESLEESKRVADEISEKVAEAKTTEEQINEARNKVCLFHRATLPINSVESDRLSIVMCVAAKHCNSLA